MDKIAYWQKKALASLSTHGASIDFSGFSKVIDTMLSTEPELIEILNEKREYYVELSIKQVQYEVECRCKEYYHVNLDIEMVGNMFLECCNFSFSTNYDEYYIDITNIIKKNVSNMLNETNIEDLYFVFRAFLLQISFMTWGMAYLWDSTKCANHSSFIKEYDRYEYQFDNNNTYLDTELFEWKEKEDNLVGRIPGILGYKCKCIPSPILIMSEDEIIKSRRQKIEHKIALEKNKIIIGIYHQFLRKYHINRVKPMNVSDAMYYEYKKELFEIELPNQNWVTIGFVFILRCIENIRECDFETSIHNYKSALKYFSKNHINESINEIKKELKEKNNLGQIINYSDI